MVQEGETFDLEHMKVLRVGGGGLMGFAWLYASRRDGPLELQNSITNVHLTQVPVVMCPFVSARNILTALETTQDHNTQTISHCFYVPFGCFSHELDVQVSTGKVVSICSGLAVEARAEAGRHRRPTESPDVWRKDTVQHLHVMQLGFRLGSIPGFRCDASRNDHAQTAELTRAQVNRYDLQYTIIIMIHTPPLTSGRQSYDPNQVVFTNIEPQME